jgi:hypothetical protein
MTDYGKFMRKPKEREAANAVKSELMKAKNARQAVLKRVRRQRAKVLKRMAVKIGGR